MASGPFETVDIGGGRVADLYLLRYTADGELISKEAQAALIATLAGRTDVFFFSHGWNNEFHAAAASYRTFIRGYAAQGTGPGDHDNPVLVGVVWPSASFTMPWDEGPFIAGDPDLARVEQIRGVIPDVLAAADAEALNDLLSRDELSPDDAIVAAELMSRLLPETDPEDGSARAAPADVLEAWRVLEGKATPPAPDDFGEPFSHQDAAPRAAGLLSALNPRNLARMGTVWLMRDRAGKVGARGVAPLLRRILDEPDVRLHLIGHSFGCRLLMSAVSVRAVPRRVRSMLLLQPAVNRWCFAANVVGTGRAGGFRPVLDRVELPVLTTMSSHDVALRQAFHLAVRGNSLGEPGIAAIGNEQRYGALGGYGPAGLGNAAAVRSVQAAGKLYDLAGAPRVLCLDGSPEINGHSEINGHPAIGGHSDINSPAMWWALRCLVHADD